MTEQDGRAIARFHEYSEWLTPTAREDFRRTEIDGLTRAERADERDVEPATVSTNIRTAKDRLRAIAEDRGEPDLMTDGGTDTFRATCSCGEVVVERDADAANLPRQNNREIAESVVGAHEFTHDWRDEDYNISRGWTDGE